VNTSTSPSAVASPIATPSTSAPPVSRRLIGWIAAVIALAAAIAISLAVGSRDIPLDRVWAILVGNRDVAADVAAVIDLRIPRTVLALLAGLALGVSGAVIQAVTRNPLADPGILGVTAGSSFAVAMAVGVLGITAVTGYIWFAFGGALVAATVVYIVGSAGRGGGSPVRLTLTGVALGAVLAGITSAMVLVDPRAFQSMRSWESGSLQDRGWDVILPVLPFLVAGVILAAVIARALNAIALGDDLASSLGANVVLTRVLSVVVVTLLAGGATAIAGPIAFVGLMVPHVARWIVGPDQRWILAYTLVLAPTLLIVADVIGRVVLRPGELPAGIVTAVLGAPVLIVLVRRQRASGL
jgi:iron complex transport system permease protein